MEEKLVIERLNRLNQWYSGKIAPPFKMLLYPTNKCNNRCIYCNNTYIRKSGRYDYTQELTIGEWERIVSEGLRLGVRRWWIQGAGEPLASPEKTVKIVEMVKKYEEATECMITTNGTLLTEEIIKKFVELSLDEIHFSLSSPQANVDDFLRGEGAFKATLTAIKKINECKRKFGKKKPKMYINSILLSKVYDKIEEFIEFCSKYEIDALVLNPLRLQGEVLDEIKKGNEKVKSLILSSEAKKYLQKRREDFYKMAREMNVELQINGIEEGYEKRESNEKITEKKKGNFFSSLCFEPFLTILIGPLGEVGCCCGFDYEHAPINIKGLSLEKVWKSKLFKEVRDRMLNSLPLPGCSSCGFKEITEQLRSELIRFKYRRENE